LYVRWFPRTTITAHIVSDAERDHPVYL